MKNSTLLFLRVSLNTLFCFQIRMIVLLVRILEELVELVKQKILIAATQRGPGFYVGVGIIFGLLTLYFVRRTRVFNAAVDMVAYLVEQLLYLCE